MHSKLTPTFFSTIVSMRKPQYTLHRQLAFIRLYQFFIYIQLLKLYALVLIKNGIQSRIYRIAGFRIAYPKKSGQWHGRGHIAVSRNLLFFKVPLKNGVHMTLDGKARKQISRTQPQTDIVCPSSGRLLPHKECCHNSTHKGEGIEGIDDENGIETQGVIAEGLQDLRTVPGTGVDEYVRENG